MSDRAAHWQTVYTTKAETEVSWYQADPATSLRLIRDAVAAPAARIIEIGGGTSRLVDALLAAGYRALTVLDISEAALATTRHRLGAAADDVTWIREDVTTWMPDATYDLWHDRAVFHFLTEARDRAAYVERVRRGVVPGGAVIIGTFALDGPDKCSGLPVVRYDAQSLSATLGSGFTLEDSCSEAHRTPWGSVQQFRFCRFRAGQSAAQRRTVRHHDDVEISGILAGDVLGSSGPHLLMWRRPPGNRLRRHLLQPLCISDGAARNFQ